MWIALGFDWACSASEIVRTRHNVVWRLSTGNVSSRNYPELAGFPNAHRTYGLSFLQGSQNRFQSTDHDPPYPIRELAATYQIGAGTPRSLDHLAPLGLPAQPRSYFANEPPQPDAASQQVDRGPSPVPENVLRRAVNGPGRSHELYFLKATPGRTWSELYEDLEEGSDDVDPQQELERDMHRELQAVLPDLELHLSEESSELVDSGHEIDLFVSGDEVCLSKFLASRTTEADSESILYKVVATVERITGRKCYDPQTDSLLLASPQ